MKTILFYGNCQSGAIRGLMSNVLKEYNVINVACWSDKINKEEFTLQIKSADVIITQPINENYRNTDYLHTEYLLKNSKSEAIIIIFPSLYFNFYYFDYNYKYLSNKVMIEEPSHYHYHGLIECYQKNKSVEYFIENYVNNINYKTEDEINENANISLNELKKRETNMQLYKKVKNCHIISAYEFIKNNYKDTLLFYSINHPTKFLFHYIINQIINILNLNDDYNKTLDPLKSSERGILYKCIQKVVNFDILIHKPNLLKTQTEDINLILNEYFNYYKNIKF